MKVHFQRVTAAQRAIIDGDLATAQSWAMELVEDKTEMPAAWQPYVAALRDSARHVAEAGDVVAAAEAIAVMAGACGNCHRDHGVTIELAASEKPVAGDDPASRMKLHQWAADRMWDGLIKPSNDAWFEGAATLSDAPLTMSEVTGDGSLAGNVDDPVAQVREWARLALDSPDAQTREHVYGHFLGACAGCHNAAR